MSDQMKLIAQLQAALPGWSREKIVQNLEHYQSLQSLQMGSPHIVPMTKSIADNIDTGIKPAPTEGLQKRRGFDVAMDKCLEKALLGGIGKPRLCDLREQASSLADAGQYPLEQILSQLEALITRELAELRDEQDMID
ncbi:hypothetical protein ACNBFH_004446 [Salmonella enterica subsp. enterica serovar Bareilly]